MRKPAVTSGGLPGTQSDARSLSVPGTADSPIPPRPRCRGVDPVLADPTTVRRIRLHHCLVRRRRWSKALDRLLGNPLRPYDPWSDPVFLAWHTVACDLAGVGRG